MVGNMNIISYFSLTLSRYQQAMNAVLVYLIPITIIGAITVLERRQNPVPTDWLRNLQAWALDIGMVILMMPYLYGWAGTALLDGAQLPFWAGFVIFLLIRDGAEFAFHLAQHNVPFLWKMHSLHHSDPEMTALTTNRHFWGDRAIKTLTVWSLAATVISPTGAMLSAYAAISFYNYFIHANLKVNFGRLCWLLNCPAYHRRHHSRLPEHYNSNYAAMFPIFDVICGTYRKPDGWPPTGLEFAPTRFGELVAWPFIQPDEAGQVTETAPA